MKKRIPFVLRIAVAIILIQTLRFKFTAHPDTVYLFETVGLEPTGRIGIGIVEKGGLEPFGTGDGIGDQLWAERRAADAH